MLLILIGALLLVGLIVYIFWDLSPAAQLSQTINEASEATQLKSTAFEIYDRSTEDYCNRLIVVKPFDWFIWAIGGQVWLLNDTNLEAPLGMTSATKIPNINNDDYTFETRNLNVQLSDIFDSYREVTEVGKLRPVRIEFKLEDLQSQPKRFTVLDALNYLFREYITMDSPEETADKQRRHQNKLVNVLDQYCLQTKSAPLNGKYSKSYLSTQQEELLRQLYTKRINKAV
jgi:hypothetical protein